MKGYANLIFFESEGVCDASAHPEELLGKLLAHSNQIKSYIFDEINPI